MCCSNLSSAYVEGQRGPYEGEPHKNQDYIYSKGAIKYIVSYITQWPLQEDS